MSKISLVNGHIDDPNQRQIDRIRSMSAVELAEFMQNGADKVCFSICEKQGNKYKCPYNTQDCIRCMATWLESEVTE